MLTAVFIALAAAYVQIRDTSVALFFIIYCIGMFFFNFGPNATTFVIPAEVFPTRFRASVGLGAK